jgi:hypothetical protein
MTSCSGSSQEAGAEKICGREEWWLLEKALKNWMGSGESRQDGLIYS